MGQSRLTFLFLVLCSSLVFSEKTKTVFNPYTGKFDFITTVSTANFQGSGVSCTGGVCTFTGGGSSTVLTSSGVAYGSATSTPIANVDDFVYNKSGANLLGLGVGYSLFLGTNPYNDSLFGSRTSTWMEPGLQLLYDENKAYAFQAPINIHAYTPLFGTYFPFNSSIESTPYAITPDSIFTVQHSSSGAVGFNATTSAGTSMGSFYFGGNPGLGQDPNVFSMDISSVTSRKNFQVIGNITIQGNNGIRSSSFTLPSGTASQCLQLNAEKNVVTSGGSCGGGSGSGIVSPSTFSWVIPSPYGLTSSTLTVSSNTILSGATFYQDTRITMGGTQTVTITTATFIQSLTQGTSSYASYNSSGTITPDATMGNNISIVLHSSATINVPINAQDFQKFTYRISQDGTTRAVILGSGFDFSNAISTFNASSGGSLVDYLGCTYNSTTAKCDINAIDTGH